MLGCGAGPSAGGDFFLPLLAEAGEFCFAVVHCACVCMGVSLLGGGGEATLWLRWLRQLICTTQESHLAASGGGGGGGGGVRLSDSLCMSTR